MKEKVSPAVVAVVVIVVLAVVGFFGMKMLGGGGKPAESAEAKANYDKMTNGGTMHAPSQADMAKNSADHAVRRMPGINPGR